MIVQKQAYNPSNKEFLYTGLPYPRTLQQYIQSNIIV